ncbi:MAG: DUF3368 domain-containing protein [Bacteroidota bacterium]
MIIISDTSVITNLVQLQQLFILESLFGQVVIPLKVYAELEKIPSQKTIIDQTTWIEIRSVSNKRLFKKLEALLDPGEAEAITLAVELKADLLLIDERKGRKVASDYGILITGLIGILIEAKSNGLVSQVKPFFDKLIFEIGFRINPKLYQEILKKIGE